MDDPGRKTLPHDRPPWLSAAQTYFITICADPRGTEVLFKLARPLIESFLWRHENTRWHGLLFLAMPDHIHTLLIENPERSIAKEIRDWKKFTARHFGIPWQRDFFEHRLRDDESRRQRYEYILQNPVRAGLASSPNDWPHVWKESDGCVQPSLPTKATASPPR